MNSLNTSWFAQLAGILSFALFALAALVLTRRLDPRGPADWILIFFPFLAGHILMAGYILSAFGQLAEIGAWLAAAALLLAVEWLAGRLLRVRGLRGLRPSEVRHGPKGLWHRAVQGYIDLGTFEKRLLMPVLIVTAILGLTNLDLILHTAPHNWDSMTYHLARMAYYLQEGSLANYGANYWAQVVHPKNETILILYAYLASGRNENLTQLVQFVAYWVASVSVYGIARRAGSSRWAGLFAAGVFALLIESLMQATTTQNDMILTALVGCVVYGLLAFRESGARTHLILAALAAGIALGVKSAVLLAAPALALVAWHALRIEFPRGRHTAVQPLLFLSSALVLAGLLFAAPAGYIENIRLYGHPIGPEYVRKLHAFEGESLSAVARYGTLNFMRYGFEFLSLDGLMPYGDINDLQQALRRWPKELTLQLGLDLETSAATRARFDYDKRPTAHEDGSYWGSFGFGLLGIAALLALLGVFQSPAARLLAAAGLLFWLAQAFSGPYDPWRGRYFVVAGVLIAPLAAIWVTRRVPGLLKVYLVVVVLVGCLSALTGVLGRANSVPEEVYGMDRVEQLTRNRRNYTQPVKQFEGRVPVTATVAVHLGEDMFEYPLFGEHLTRRLLPVNPFDRGPQPIPPEADFLLYSSRLYNEPRPTDAHLGEDWYLRDLRS